MGQATQANGSSKICGRHALKKMTGCGLPISFQIFQMLSSTNFTWFIREYLDPNVV